VFSIYCVVYIYAIFSGQVVSLVIEPSCVIVFAYHLLSLVCFVALAAHVAEVFLVLFLHFVTKDPFQCFVYILGFLCFLPPAKDFIWAKHVPIHSNDVLAAIISILFVFFMLQFQAYVGLVCPYPILFLDLYLKRITKIS
jgi:hypothetical protein